MTVIKRRSCDGIQSCVALNPLFLISPCSRFFEEKDQNFTQLHVKNEGLVKGGDGKEKFMNTGFREELNLLTFS